MGRGRPRKSVGAHKVDGTYEPGRHDGYGVSSPGVPTMPKHFTKHKRWLWEQIINGLPKQCFGHIDGVSLATACELWDAWQRHKDEDSPQRFYKGLSALKQCSAILSKFGWTPSDRAKMLTPPSDEQGEDNKFFGVAG